MWQKLPCFSLKLFAFLPTHTAFFSVSLSISCGHVTDFWQMEYEQLSLLPHCVLAHKNLYSPSFPSPCALLVVRDEGLWKSHAEWGGIYISWGPKWLCGVGPLPYLFPIKLNLPAEKQFFSFIKPLRCKYSNKWD